MDREIKFRAWHKKYKKMYKVLHLHLNSFDGIWVTVKGHDCIENKDINIQIQPKDIELMQYTGLKDKNGVEIYEGDIVQYNSFLEDNVKSLVVFEKGIFFAGYLLKDALDFEAIVIGNIYDNPELLET